MISRSKSSTLSLLREKRANALDPLTTAVDQAAAGQMQSDAFRDMRNLALLGAGAGVAGRGVVGLVNLLKGTRPSTKRLQGPAELPMPVPYHPDEEEQLKTAGITEKTSLPYYGPGMMLAGLAGAGIGWKGADMVLDHRRQAERQQELEKARSEFHDVLLSQYDQPYAQGSGQARIKSAGDGAAIATELDNLFNDFEKCATMADIGGKALGMYGTYASLAALMGGTWAFDKAKRRSRRAVLESALKKRQQQQFATSPTEIYAVPEPAMAAP